MITTHSPLDISPLDIEGFTGVHDKADTDLRCYVLGQAASRCP